MNDFENKGIPDQEVPQEPHPAPEEPQQAPAQEEAPQANPYASQVPHLTFDPNEPDPFQGDPFHSPEPPRAPEPPQPEPEYQQPPQQNYYQPQYVVPQYNVPPAGYNQKSRLAAGLLGILLGTLGVHNFYLGFTTRGVVQLLVSIIGGIFTCGMATVAIAVWGFVEGVLLLAASPSRMYDGHGVILRD